MRQGVKNNAFGFLLLISAFPPFNFANELKSKIMSEQIKNTPNIQEELSDILLVFDKEKRKSWP